ncbi:peptidylprolyl isomerase [Humisphaera borealis]|uniref:peptidylprolyl isomerase n=1 Tax=Humisphaera borealis TaxID=2807512 RepID=A0A7M2WTL5_9BACT|nr:peptidylprolyl isomerase [Humisphaera borealis]QOV88826.1 peptidylprolyl isomerase [Humisphaera borealis]
MPSVIRSRARRSSRLLPVPAPSNPIEALERRTLLSVAVGSTIKNTFGLPGGAPTDINLAGAFDDTAVQGVVARLNTSLGNVDIELYDKAVTKTVQNFVNYIANNLYNQTVLHRLVSGFVLQGGGYIQTGAHIQEGPKIKNEFSTARPNLRGTISMVTVPATDSLGNPVPGGGPNSATSEWVINLADNPSLDTSNGGFTVFGQVINGTLSVVDQIAALPIIDASAVSPVFSELPVRNTPAGNPTADDFVFINSAGIIADTQFLTLSATSDDPSIVNPTVSDGILRLNYGSQQGSARITVTARDSSGNESSQTFTAGVGEYTVQIGSGGIGSKLDFAESDGGKGSIALSKSGSAFVRLAGEGLGLTNDKKPKLTGTVSAIDDITTIDTGTGTSLTIKSAGGDGIVDVRGVSVDGPLKTFSAKTTRLSGNTTIGGTVRTMSLGAVNSANVVLGGSPADGIQLGLTLTTATDSNFTSGMPIKSIKAGAFVDTLGTPGTITAPALSSITTSGLLQESINAPGGIIKTFKAGGAQKGDITATAMVNFSALDIQGGVWNFSQPYAAGRDTIKKMIVTGSMTGTTIRTAGSIGSISVLSVVSGRIYAGVDVTDEEFPPFLPTQLSQFTSPARLGSLKVSFGSEQLSVAATSMGRVDLSEIGTDAAIPFGIAATQIDQLTGKTADTELGLGTPFSLKDLDDQAAFDAAVAALQLPTGNFIVSLF